MKPSRELIVQEILDQLKGVGLSRSQCLAINDEKWKVPVRTVDRYWKKAQELFQEYLNKVNAAKEEVSISAEVDALNEGLKKKLERQLELQAMLSPEYRVEEKVLQKTRQPDGQWKVGAVTIERKLFPKEIVAIHAELSRMSGDYAAQKLRLGGDKDAPPIQTEQTPGGANGIFVPLEKLTPELKKALFYALNTGEDEQK